MIGASCGGSVLEWLLLYLCCRFVTGCAHSELSQLSVHIADWKTARGGLWRERYVCFFILLTVVHHGAAGSIVVRAFAL